MPWYIIVAFILLNAAIIMSGYKYFDHQKQYLKKEKQDELNAIVVLKKNQLASWQKERLADAKSIFNNQMVQDSLRSLLKGDASAALHSEILAWFKSFSLYQGYSKAAVLNSKGKAKLIFPETSSSPDFGNLLPKNMPSDGIVFKDFYRNASKTVSLGLLVMITENPSDPISPAGYIYLEIDPDEYLYPLIQTWPTPSKTAETLLVRREGYDVVFLNELRHQKNTALNLRLPVATINLPAAIAVQGFEGVIEGYDYRHKHVFSAINKVSGTPWFIIAKIDSDEVYEPIRELELRVASTIVLIIIISWSIAILLFRRIQAQALRKQIEEDQERLILMKHFEYLLKYANDIIILADSDYKIAEVNKRAEELYGYSRQELIGMEVLKLRSPETRDSNKKIWDGLDRKEGRVFETIHVRKDGTTFPVEVSLRVIEVDERIFYQEILRDITERKNAELEREQLVLDLKKALADVKTLSGLIPICANCKKIRDDKGFWNQLESYISRHSDAVFSHGICPDCVKKLYPELTELMKKGDSLI